MSNFNTNCSATAATSPVSPDHETRITVLKSLNAEAKLNKRYYLEDGELTTQPYANAFHFKAKSFAISNITQLADLINVISKRPNQCLIRGIHHHVQVEHTVRRKELFPEHPDGTPWVMIDFDDIALPQNTDPLSQAAIEYGISLLPSCFQNVSYYFQHSSSAGIETANGQLRKKGLNAHAFFWLNRRIQGPVLSAWLQEQSIDAKRYLICENKGGVPMIRHPFDPAVVKNSVQPHYTALPTIEDGVTCRLDAEQRQGLVNKASNAVVLPSIETNPIEVKRWEGRLRDQWKIANGAVLMTVPTGNLRGTAIRREWVMPSASIERGRKCIGYTFPDDKKDRIHLIFDQENSPGSWWVGDKTPTTARRYGDEAELPLWELSSSAFDMVAHELGWFYPIIHYPHQLDDRGYLPNLDPLISATATTILAPTGSGKTYTVAQWIRQQQDLVIYTAETIALNHQTFEDLQGAGVNVGFYQQVGTCGSVAALNCIVTTHQSLPRILSLVRASGRSYSLVIDEVHMAIDYALKSSHNLERLENGIKDARKTICLTGTITDLQSRFLSDMLFRTLGSLDETLYQVHEFRPRKQNPLEVWSGNQFAPLVYGALQRVKAALERSEQPPRVVVIAPTSKMALFNIILQQLGIAEHADVVSKFESDQAAINTARTSTKPILISSPLFALGINFVVPPGEMYVGIGRLEVDTNWIQQAVNRANRTELPCRVVLCVEGSDINPVPLPQKIIQRMQAEYHLENESTLHGLLQQHFHLDRVTAKLLREEECNSAKSTHVLIDGDCVQNYKVVEKRSEKAECDDDAMKELRAAAREYYDDLIRNYQLPYHVQENLPFFARLSCMRDERRSWMKTTQSDLDSDPWTKDLETVTPYLTPQEEVYLFGASFHDALWLRDQEAALGDDWEPRLEVDRKSQELALVADFCGLSVRSHIEDVSIIKLRRLLGDALPWVSGQFYGSEAQYEAMARKLAEIRAVLDALEGLRDGNTTEEFAGLIRGKGRIRAGIRALANNEAEFHKLAARHDALQQLKDAYQKSSSKGRNDEINQHCFDQAIDLFKSLGIRWKQKQEGKKTVTDYDKPLLSSHWNFKEARASLSHLTAICRASSGDATPLHLDGSDELTERQIRYVVESVDGACGSRDFGLSDPIDDLRMLGYRSGLACRNCLFNRGNACMKGLPIDWLDDMPAGSQVSECRKHKEMPAKLQA